MIGKKVFIPKTEKVVMGISRAEVGKQTLKVCFLVGCYWLYFLERDELQEELASMKQNERIQKFRDLQGWKK